MSTTTKKAGTTVRIRSVGPMTLTNCTEYELTQLRQAVSRPNSKVKYLALCKTDNNVQIVAQASHKLSTSAWRQCLSMRIAVRSNANIQDSIELFKKNPAINKSFEEFGVFGRHINDQANKTSSKAGDSSGEELEDDMPIHVKLLETTTSTKPVPAKPVPVPAKPQEDRPRRSDAHIKLYKGIHEQYKKRLAWSNQELTRKLQYTVTTVIDPNKMTLDNPKRVYSGIKPTPPVKTPAQCLETSRTAFLRRLRVQEIGLGFASKGIRSHFVVTVPITPLPPRPVVVARPPATAPVFVEPPAIVEAPAIVQAPVITGTRTVGYAHDIDKKYKGSPALFPFFSALINTEEHETRFLARDLLRKYEQFHINHAYEMYVTETTFGC